MRVIAKNTQCFCEKLCLAHQLIICPSLCCTQEPTIRNVLNFSLKICYQQLMLKETPVSVFYVLLIN